MIKTSIEKIFKILKETVCNKKMYKFSLKDIESIYDKRTIIFFVNEGLINAEFKNKMNDAIINIFKESKLEEQFDSFVEYATSRRLTATDILKNYQGVEGLNIEKEKIEIEKMYNEKNKKSETDKDDVIKLTNFFIGFFKTKTATYKFLCDALILKDHYFKNNMPPRVEIMKFKEEEYSASISKYAKELYATMLQSNNELTSKIYVLHKCGHSSCTKTKIIYDIFNSKFDLENDLKKYIEAYKTVENIKEETNKKETKQNIEQDENATEDPQIKIREYIVKLCENSNVSYKEGSKIIKLFEALEGYIKNENNQRDKFRKEIKDISNEIFE